MLQTAPHSLLWTNMNEEIYWLAFELALYFMLMWYFVLKSFELTLFEFRKYKLIFRERYKRSFTLAINKLFDIS